MCGVRGGQWPVARMNEEPGKAFVCPAERGHHEEMGRGRNTTKNETPRDIAEATSTRRRSDWKS